MKWFVLVILFSTMNGTSSEKVKVLGEDKCNKYAEQINDSLVGYAICIEGRY